ncbi:MAG: hypothetical protein DRH06_01000 [Deltaproteobacteria bacterium]|nr:MAG: hypothetical protein DRH07_08115 [Deltaproteobacteria bacterium]RLB78711.1 MAG: hypothetical protein DRH06_01000 [Deltaproteobacteria bacterium]
MIFDGVAKSPPYGVTAFFQDFDIPMYPFALEKTLRLVGRNFYLAIFFIASALIFQIAYSACR